jgi:hypothetical protein
MDDHAAVWLMSNVTVVEYPQTWLPAAFLGIPQGFA